jgi:hypothetical protein
MPAPAASVALDIGPGSGALVIYPDERFRGREIEISRARSSGSAPGPSGSRTHTGVLERHTGSGRVLTAIFGSVPAGDYVVWMDGSRPGGTVTVAEGLVTEISLTDRCRAR